MAQKMRYPRLIKRYLWILPSKILSRLRHSLHPRTNSLKYPSTLITMTKLSVMKKMACLQARGGSNNLIDVSYLRERIQENASTIKDQLLMILDLVCPHSVSPLIPPLRKRSEIY